MARAARRHHHTLGVVVLAAALSLLAGAVRAQPALAGPDPEVGDATTLGPLPPFAGSGPFLPQYGRAQVTPQQPVAVSTQPRLRSGMSTSGQYTFQLAPVSGAGATVRWRSYPSSGPDFTVPPGAGLAHGRSYQWRVQAPDGTTAGPYSLIVDLVAERSQATDSSTPIGVSLATGFVRYTWRGHAMHSAAGDIAVGLDYHPANTGSPELPDRGWRLVVTSATGYQHLQVNPGGSVDVVSKGNSVVTYVDNGDGFYQPVQPVSGPPTVTGSYGVLVRNGDGSFTMTDTTRATVTFAAPDARGRATVTSESVSGVEQIRRGYDPASGRLTSITDPVSERSVTLSYGGDERCPDYRGFEPAGPDLLCRVSYWDGTSTAFGYVSTGSGVQLGRVVDFADAASPAVTDLGYDQAGRLAAMRAPLTAQALASPAGRALTGDDPTAADLLTEVDYDAAGRVGRVTAPAPEIGSDRMSVDYSYGTDNVTRVVTGDGQRHSLGYDPATLATVRVVNPDGGVTSTRYDDRGNPVQAVDAAGGVTRSDYDAAGMITTRSTPGGGQVRFGYDRTYGSSDPSDAGRPMRGLDVTYWANDRWSGAPASDELGPLPAPGRPLPGSLDVTWAGPPVPGVTAWSARLGGILTLPQPAAVRRPPAKRGTKPPRQRVRAGQRDTFAFRINGPNQPALWIDGVRCLPRDCLGPGVVLPGGDHRIRIDLRVADGQQGALQLRYSRNGGPMTTVPTDVLRPDYRLTTEQASLDSLRSGASTLVSTRSSFTQPQLGLVGASWNSAGLTTTTDYDTDPRVGTRSMVGGRLDHTPRVVGSTLPAGNRTGIGYWGATESASPPCPDQEPAVQGGLPRDAVSPDPATGDPTGLTTRTWYTAAGRIAAVRTGDGAVQCHTYGDDGMLARTDVIAADEVVASMRYETGVGGDPLRSRTVSTVAGDEGEQVLVSTTQLDLLGRPVAVTDVWGNTQRTTYTVGGKVADTTTTAGPYRLQTTNTYDDGLLVATIVSDSLSGGDPVLTARVAYDKAQRMTGVRYSNGVTGSFDFAPSGVPDDLGWTEADGTSWWSRRTMAPSGRVLAAETGNDRRNARTTYTYDRALRLQAADLDTDQQVDASSWSYGYDRNSNRTRQVVDGKAVTYTYDRADRLTRVAGDPALSGSVQYDGVGNITALGDLRLTYDETGAFVSGRDVSTRSQVTYQRDAAGSVVARTLDDDSGTVTVRYGIGGLQLDGQGVPRGQSVQLPGGVTVQRDLTAAPGPAAQTWLYPGLDGSTMLATDGRGRTQDRRLTLYDPFGAAITTQPASPQRGAPLLGWQAQAGVSTDDLGSQLVLMGERLYLPALGRFAQLDPQRGGSANDYDYANQDPVNSRDLTGRAAWWQWLITIAVSVALTVVTYGAMTAAAGSIVAAGMSTTATVVASTVAGGLIGSAGASAIYVATTPIMGGELSWSGFAAAAAVGFAGSLYSGYAAMWFVGQSIRAGSFNAAAAAGRVGWGALLRNSGSVREAVGTAVLQPAQAGRAALGRAAVRAAIRDTMCMEAKADLIYGTGVGLRNALDNPRDPSRGQPTLGKALQYGLALPLSTFPGGCT